jgi:hypothetical protein
MPGRYLAEFDFHYSNRIAPGFDAKVRAEKLAAAFVG